jgi:hypothetical protein
MFVCCSLNQSLGHAAVRPCTCRWCKASCRATPMPQCDTVSSCAPLFLQVVQGKLSSDPNAPVAWLGFLTDTADMRTCGNVQTTHPNAVITKWGSQFDESVQHSNGAPLPGNRTALSVLPAICAGTKANHRLASLQAPDFRVPLPPMQSLGYGLPACCTPFMTTPATMVPSSDRECCLEHFVDMTDQGGLCRAPPAAPKNPVCPGACLTHAYAHMIPRPAYKSISLMVPSSHYPW